jgi:SAM-dependent MidA family methyltransferase
MSLPSPDAQALVLSRALSQRIAQDIAQQGGWIGFDAFMHRVLYEPGLGYYTGPMRKFGAQGDFVTAPELSPLFAQCLAAQVSQWFDQTEPVVVEFGAGSGRLAAGLLKALHELGTPACSYLIIEVSASLRERQRETIAQLAPDHLGVVQWLDTLPEKIDGVVIGNELLDAMPVRVFEIDSGKLLEVGVSINEDGAFAWATLAADQALIDAVKATLSDSPDDLRDESRRDSLNQSMNGPQSEVSSERMDGGAHPASRYRSEIGLQGRAWVETVGRALHRGAMLLIDYGFSAREYYHPQRDQGTLVAHFRHRVHTDVFHLPGLQDVTAHVDFSAIARAGAAAGLDLLGYTSQSRWLINCGLLDRLAALTSPAQAGEQGAAATIEAARTVGAAQTLLSEAEMGELFKVIAFGRGLADDALGFVRGDRRGTL